MLPRFSTNWLPSREEFVSKEWVTVFLESSLNFSRFVFFRYLCDSRWQLKFLLLCDWICLFPFVPGPFQCSLLKRPGKCSWYGFSIERANQQSLVRRISAVFFWFVSLANHVKCRIFTYTNQVSTQIHAAPSAGKRAPASDNWVRKERKFFQPIAKAGQWRYLILLTPINTPQSFEIYPVLLIVDNESFGRKSPRNNMTILFYSLCSTQVNDVLIMTQTWWLCTKSTHMLSG